MKTLREDLRLASALESGGWKIVRHVMDKDREIPNFALSFQRGDRRVWFTGRKWISADLIGSQYVNHAQFNALQEAINHTP